MHLPANCIYIEMSSTIDLEAAANAAIRLGYEEGLKANQLKVVHGRFYSGMDIFIPYITATSTTVHRHH